MKKLLILLLLIPIVSFGEEKYACERTQLNVKTKVIESITTVNFDDGQSHEFRTIYKITSSDEKKINGYNDDMQHMQVITFIKTPPKVIFVTVGAEPLWPDDTYVFSSTSSCIKIK